MFTGFVAVLGGEIHKSTSSLLPNSLPSLTMFTSLVLSGGGEVEIDLLIGNVNTKQTNKSKDIFRLNFVRYIKSSLVCTGREGNFCFQPLSVDIDILIFCGRDVLYGTKRLVSSDFENHWQSEINSEYQFLSNRSQEINITIHYSKQYTPPPTGVKPIFSVTRKFDPRSITLLSWGVSETFAGRGDFSKPFLWGRCLTNQNIWLTL